MINIVLNDSRYDWNIFISQLSEALAPRIAEIMKNPYKNDVCSQRKAKEKYGQANVLRWKREGKLKPFSKRPGKIEYKIKDLEELYNTEQDYM